MFRKTVKKVLAAVLAIAILVCGIPFAAAASVPEMNNTYPHTVFENKDLVWEWIKYSGESMT